MPSTPITQGDKIVNYPAVWTDLTGARTANGTEVTLIVRKDGNVGMVEHQMLVEFAAEVLADNRMAMEEYADQVLAPHPLTGALVEVFPFLTHNGEDVQVGLGLAASGKGILYTWTI